MAKKSQEITELVAPSKITAAPLVGMSTRVDLPANVLPEEFGGMNLETIETGFSPTVKWTTPGQMCAGVYEGYEEKVGPNSSNLYNFNARGKKFGVWGSTVLDRAIIGALKNGQLHAGEMVAIIYVGDVETDMNPCKIFHIKVAKKA